MTNADDFDDPEREASWLNDRRQQVVEYLEAEGVQHGGVADEAEWFVAPYLSVWPVMSLRAPGSVGWWAIAGDLPTDYISSRGVADVRAVLRSFAARWAEVAGYMRRGEPHPTVKIGEPADWTELSTHLALRAEMLNDIAADEDHWS